MADYPDRYTEWIRPFTITISDPCDESRLSYTALPLWCPKPIVSSFEFEIPLKEPEWMADLEDKQLVVG